ncbi:MAG: hypothetical protein ABFQ62_03735, partial [Patescibacteria group bacterium]
MSKKNKISIRNSEKYIENVENIVDRLPRGYVFTCNEFIGKVKGREALVKALNRLAASGKIV